MSRITLRNLDICRTLTAGEQTEASGGLSLLPYYYPSRRCYRIGFRIYCYRVYRPRPRFRPLPWPTGPIRGKLG